MTERKSSVAIICELIVHYIQGLSSNPNKGKKVGTPNLWPYKIHSSFIQVLRPHFFTLLCEKNERIYHVEYRLSYKTSRIEIKIWDTNIQFWLVFFSDFTAVEHLVHISGFFLLRGIPTPQETISCPHMKTW